MLSKVKYFFTAFERATHPGVTKFQGSEDGVSYTDLFTVDELAHDGWNTFEWKVDASKPKYRYYRFAGSKLHSCDISEIRLSGVETISSSNENVVCDSELFVNGVAQSLV